MTKGAIVGQIVIDANRAESWEIIEWIVINEDAEWTKSWRLLIELYSVIDVSNTNRGH